MDRIITVIGGCNLDMEGRSTSKLKFYDSNPGRFTMSPGGVGRNIAENLARLGLPVRLLTALGEDHQGEILRQSSQALGIDMEDCLYLDGPTPVYLSILDELGEMVVAINQMDILKEIDSEFIEKKKRLLSQSALLVLDANLEEEALASILRSHGDKRIFVDLVSTSKGVRYRDHLGSIYGLKANLLELEELLARSLVSLEDKKKALKELLAQGVREVYLTLGEEGVLLASREKLIHVRGRLRDIKSVTGAGDAFLAGAIYGNYQGWQLEDLASFAQAAALLTLENEKSSKVFDRKIIEKRRKEVETRLLSW